HFCNGNSYRALEYYGLSNLAEENEWGHFNSARILQNQKELDSAFKKYDQAIKLKPDFPQAFRHQAEILTLQGDIDTAFKKLEKSQQLNPNDPETNKLLAEHYIDQGDNKKALTYLKAIHYRDPDVLEKIKELEQKKSLLNRIVGRFRNQ
ncbi:MAG: tetratricopeptide repeat protein, partial [Candidatus Heimdallarchaeota archaeon]